MEGEISLSDELQTHRKLALKRAQMEADFEIKLKALEKIKSALANAPDLDVDKVIYQKSYLYLVEKFLKFLRNIFENNTVIFKTFSAI